MHSRFKATSGFDLAHLQSFGRAISGVAIHLCPSMKTTLLIAAFSLGLMSNVHGAGSVPYYWDINGATSGAGPTTTPAGTWSSTSTNWSSSSGGTGITGTFPSGNTAVFSAGTNA